MISKVLQLLVGFQLSTTTVLRYALCCVDPYPTPSISAPHIQAIILKTTLII
jgi:hypothetical protein